MDVQRWQQVEAIFQAALEREPGDRSSFLDDVCSGDEDLRSQVEAMLSSDEEGWSLLEQNAFEAAADLLADDPAELTAGQWVGHYAVQGLLGRGGMGEVYLAEDTRLGRKVALKLLPAGYTKNESRLRRFRQEARAASALNHPNILTIHDVWEIQGRHLIATEYIEGETLRQRMKRGALAIEEVLDISVQAASALSEAHQAGIVHLDVKPENIMLRRDGYVKVLDFGLAKLSGLEWARSDGTDKPQGEAGPAPGPLVGTVRYMSPEQARGLALDARSDIFSLGAVIYEMLAGRPAFDGETRGGIIAAILQDEPPSLPSHLPGELARIVVKALRKDREERYQSVTDLLTDLRELCKDRNLILLEGRLTQASITGRESTSTVRRRRWLAAVVAAALVLAAAAGIAWWAARPQAPRRPFRLSHLVAYSDYTSDPAVSPDGKYMAFVSNRANEGNTDLWVQSLSGGEPVRLTSDPADEFLPEFSPDGTEIVFVSRGKDRSGIFAIPTQGGEPRRVAPSGGRPRWSPDGRWVAYEVGPASGSFGPDSGIKIFLIPAEGGEPRQFRPDFLTASKPAWSPDGKYLIFMGLRDRGQEENDWWVAPVDGGEAVKTGTIDIFGRHSLSAPPGRWVPGNYILFTSNDGGMHINIWRIPLTPGTWQTQDKPERLTSGTNDSITPAPFPDGRFLFTNVKGSINMWSLPLKADEGEVIGEPQQLTRDEAYNAMTSLSADGDILAYTSNRSYRDTVWIRDLKAGKEVRLAAPDGSFGPAISPDGGTVVYGLREGQYPGDRSRSLYSVAVSGGAAERLTSGTDLLPNGWLFTQNKVLFQAGENNGDGSPQVLLLDLQTKKQHVVLEPKEYKLLEVQPSRDDRWITFVAVHQGLMRVFAAPLYGDHATPEAEWVGVTEWEPYVSMPHWGPDGNLLYFASGRDGAGKDRFGCVWAQRVDRVRKRPVGEPFAVRHFHDRQKWLHTMTVGKDKLIISREDISRSIWLAEPQ